MQLILVGVTVLLALIGIRAEVARQHTPRRSYYHRLGNTTLPVVLTAMLFVGYFIAIFAKADFSIALLEVLNKDESKTKNSSVSSLFPFSVGALDITTVLLVVNMMAVIRGYTHQSVSAFRLAAVSAVVQVATAYPAIIANIRYYDNNELSDDTKCRDFFINYGTTVLNPFGVPDDAEAERYCQDWRVSLAGQVMVFVFMHVQAVSCAFTFKANSGRPSEVFDALDVTAPLAGAGV